MIIDTSLSIDEELLRSELRSYRPPSVSIFPFPDRYLAMSVLQKSIRRKEQELALSAGNFLREVYPRHFWQRIRIIALEDIGLADLDLVRKVLLVSSKPHAWGG